MRTEVVVVVDMTLHELEAIKRMCYGRADRFASRLERINETHVQVSCHSLDGGGLADDFEDTFQRDLVDFGIRVTLAKETALVRDLIYRQAFVEADF